MNIALGLAKEMECKVQDVKSLAKGLGLDLDNLDSTQHEGLSEAIALFKTGKTINEACGTVLNNAKGSITKAETVSASQVKSRDSASMPGGLKEHLNGVTSTQAKEGRPKTVEVISTILNQSEEETLEAIADYTRLSYQNALMNELNDPSFLDELDKAIAEGKSQT